MIYNDFIYYVAVTLMYAMAIYFLVILCAGQGYRIHSFVILVACLIGVAIPESKNDSMEEFLRCANTAMLLEIVTSFSLAMLLAFDKIAWKQSLLLAFATLCHFMVIWHLTIKASFLSLFFYSFYDELIITVGILQMMVSYNGIYTAFRNIRESILGSAFYFWCYNKGLSSFKIRKRKA